MKWVGFVLALGLYVRLVRSSRSVGGPASVEGLGKSWRGGSVGAGSGVVQYGATQGQRVSNAAQFNVSGLVNDTASAGEAVGWLDSVDPSFLGIDQVSGLRLAMRASFLFLVFLFPALTACLAYLWPWFREKVWFGALTQSLALSGTAFIKWGQWSSTRPDMFPEGLCKMLTVLHKDAPAHRYTYTKKLVERAYGGKRIEEVM
ncbi:unnamed protein product [Choristocarpus tenellus]